MRKLTVALLFVIAILLAGRFWQELNSIANAGGDDPISTLLNGDVNGDQILDMSDAVYLLIHLFNGGPDPVAFGDTPEMLDRVSRLEDGLLGMVEAQDTLEEDFRDLTENLRSSASDLILFADGIQLRGTIITPDNRNNCGRLIPCEEAGFEGAEILQGGEINAEDGRLYFETDHQADVIVEMPSWWQNGGGRNNRAWLDWSHGGSVIHAVNRPSGTLPQSGYVRFVLQGLPAGQHSIGVNCSVDVRCDNLGEPVAWRSSISSITIRYMN